MPRQIDPAISTVLKKFGFGPDACWDCHGVWVVYHRVLEQIAVKAGIQFDPPTVIEANSKDGVAAICVVGRMGDAAIWSIGEASPKNNKNAYCFAMAEKRAVDRVILKLIGLHGLAYSEEEADTFKDNAPAEPKTPKNPPGISKFRENTRTFYADMRSCGTVEELNLFLGTADVKAFLARAEKDFPAEYEGDGADIKGIRGEIDAYRHRLEMAAATPALIPVPAIDKVADKWAAWCPKLATTIQDCPIDRIDGWLEANKAPLERLKLELPAWHTKLMAKVEAARTSPIAA